MKSAEIVALWYVVFCALEPLIDRSFPFLFLLIDRSDTMDGFCPKCFLYDYSSKGSAC